MVLRYLDLMNTGTIEYECDLTKYLAKSIDILAFKMVKVKVDYQKSEDILDLGLNITCQLVLACDVTGKGVESNLDVMEDLKFGKTLDCDYPLTEEIDLDELVYGYIVSEKPYVVYHSSVNIEEI
ncbi:MAG: hypothetical protein LBV55_01685 [Acholeplasmatales bacterium]|jgi:uncharacterized protein|nr:hypothetical protein [Acholeplasmatales bacterium]